MDKQNKKEKINTVPELAKMINRSFQTNQEYMDKRFDKVDERFNEVEGKLDKVGGRLGKVEKKLDGFIERYDEDKLPMRADYIENVLNLPKKVIDVRLLRPMSRNDGWCGGSIVASCSEAILYS